MTRPDDQRVVDILEAAAEIVAIVDQGKPAWDKDCLLRRRRLSALARSSSLRECRVPERLGGSLIAEECVEARHLSLGHREEVDDQNVERC